MDERLDEQTVCYSSPVSPWPEATQVQSVAWSRHYAEREEWQKFLARCPDEEFARFLHRKLPRKRLLLAWRVLVGKYAPE